MKRKFLPLALFLGIAGLALAFVGVTKTLASKTEYGLPLVQSNMKYAFKNGNNVYVFLTPDGLGGYIHTPILTKLLEINTANGEISDLIPASLSWFNSNYFAKAQNRFIFVAKNSIYILDLKAKKNVWSFALPGEINNKDGQTGQVTAIKSTANGRTIQFIVGYGPDNEYSVYYSLDIKTKKLNKGKTVSGIVKKL